MDLIHFPMSRQLVRLLFVATQNTFNYIFVPWSYMLPFYELVEMKEKDAPAAGSRGGSASAPSGIATASATKSERYKSAALPGMHKGKTDTFAGSPSAEAHELVGRLRKGGKTGGAAAGNDDSTLQPGSTSVSTSEYNRRDSAAASASVYDLLLSSQTQSPGASRAGDGAAPQPVDSYDSVRNNTNIKRYKLVQLRHRPSIFKGRSRMSESWILRSHFLECYPLSWLASMPSGAKYSRFHLVLQMECVPTFYVLNVHFILFCLVALAFSTFLVSPDDVGTRMQVLLTLVLSLAAYKVSLNSWMPIKPYVTRLDVYVLLAFAITSAMGADVMLVGGLCSLVTSIGYDIGAGGGGGGNSTGLVFALSLLELVVWLPAFALWVAAHLYGMLGGSGSSGGAGGSASGLLCFGSSAGGNPTPAEAADVSRRKIRGQTVAVGEDEDPDNLPGVLAAQRRKWSWWWGLAPLMSYPSWADILAIDDVNVRAERDFVETMNQRGFNLQRANVPHADTILGKLERNELRRRNCVVDGCPINKAAEQNGVCEPNVCECDHGAPASAEACWRPGGNQCDPTGCTDGYHYKVSSVSIIGACGQKDIGTCMENVCTCTNGTAVVAPDCGTDGDNSCSECHTGFHLDAITADHCEPNVCTCPNGSEASGADCTADNEMICVKCDDGFSLTDGSCVQNTCSCEYGNLDPDQTKCTQDGAQLCLDCTEAFYHLEGSSCVPNVCICTNGEPVDECENHNSTACASCAAGFHDEVASEATGSDPATKQCTANTCTCDNGTPQVTDADSGSICAGHNTEQCAECANTFSLDGDLCVRIPVNCEVTEFAEWADVTCRNAAGNEVTCGVGKQTRERTIITPAAGTGTPCPASASLTEEKDCFITACEYEVQSSECDEATKLSVCLPTDSSSQVCLVKALEVYGTLYDYTPGTPGECATYGYIGIDTADQVQKQYWDIWTPPA
eukprot:g7027.t1